MGKSLQSMYPPYGGKLLLAAVGLILSVFTTLPGVHAAEKAEKTVQELRQGESPKITITVKNGSLEQVLLQVKQKSGYYILYNSSAVKGVTGVSVNMRDASVESVLDASLKGSGFEYSINNGTIVIKSRKADAPPPSQKEDDERKFTVSGQVTDKATKKPLVGASVYIKGGFTGVITDSDGRYQLIFDRKPGVVVVYSFVGMESKDIAYNGQTELNVVLSEKPEDVQSIVVTGYAPIKRESFTGNTVSISKNELLKVSKTNVLKAIQNFDASFRIMENNQWGSDPNALPEVYIRGESGIGTKELDRDEYSKSNMRDNPNLPLFILDGFEISAQKLYDMDPNRIENITILKDAAATAIYGSRAANGVVVITAVAPTPGKLNVNYSMTGTVVAPDISDYNLLNAAEKLDLEWRAGCYDSPQVDNRNQIELNKEYYAKLANVLKGVDTYWLSKPLRTAFNHKHSLYIDGGSETLRFGVDLQYTNEDGVMKGSKRDRVGAGFYLQYVYKNISIRNYASFQQADSEESPYGNFENFTSAQPYDEYLDEDGNYLDLMKQWSNSVYDKENPLYESGLHNYDRTRNQEFKNDLSINWNITPYLNLRGQFSISRTVDNSDRFYDPLSKRNSSQLSLANVSSGTLYTQRGNGLKYDAKAFLNYNRTFVRHNINFQAGMNLLEGTSDNLSSTYIGFPSGALNSVNYAQRLEGKPINSESTKRTVSFLAALNYSYDNIYLFDLAGSFDGDSSFGKDKRFAPFWSAGVGMNIHNYESMKGSSFLSLLRLRATYGHTGKVNFPAYAARTSYTVLNDEWYKTGFGATLTALGNKNLKWETTKTFDAGFELGLWQNRFFTKFSFYNRLTVDLINDVTIPSSTGFTMYRDNVGEIRNRGVEVDLRVTAVQTKDLQLIFNANLSHNKNRIMKVSESLKEYNRLVQDKISSGNIFQDEFMSKPFMQFTEGISKNSIWGMKSLGINPANGEEVFETLDGQLTDKWITSQQRVLGDRDPKVRGMFSATVVWRQFSLYASFMYEAGGQRYNQTLADKVEGVSIYRSNVDRRVLSDRWSTPGQRALYKKMVPGRSGVEMTRSTSRFVQNFNMLQLNSINLGYDFKRSVIAPLHLSMLRLELAANDLFYASSVKQERGLSYPYARSFTFSVTASF